MVGEELRGANSAITGKHPMPMSPHADIQKDVTLSKALHTSHDKKGYLMYCILNP